MVNDMTKSIVVSEMPVGEITPFTIVLMYVKSHRLTTISKKR